MTKHYYAVTASDRYGNESAPAQEYYDGVIFHEKLNVPYLINRVLKGRGRHTETAKERKAREKSERKAVKAAEKARAKAEKEATKVEMSKNAKAVEANKKKKPVKAAEPKATKQTKNDSNIKSAATYKPKHKTYTRTIKVKKK